MLWLDIKHPPKTLVNISHGSEHFKTLNSYAFFCILEDASSVTVYPVDSKLTHTPRMGSQSDTITILHFNDVYNIEPREQEPVGGASRFKTAIKQRAHLNPLVMFSGDAFSPSLSM